MTNPMQMYPDIVSRFERLSPSGENRMKARCPAHDDSTPSLSISISEKGNLMLKCFAGCKFGDICKAIGVNVRDTFSTAGAPKPKIVDIYDYRDEDWNMLFQKVRYFPKDFRLRRSEQDWSMSGVRKVLYNLPKVIRSAEQPVYIVEGEKDVKTLDALDILATSSYSSSVWTKEFSQCLSGRDVVIVPDNDAKGYRYARMVASWLRGFAKTLRIWEPPGLAIGGDITSWVEKIGFGPTGTKQCILDMSQACPLYDHGWEEMDSEIRLGLAKLERDIERLKLLACKRPGTYPVT